MAKFPGPSEDMAISHLTLFEDAPFLVPSVAPFVGSIVESQEEGKHWQVTVEDAAVRCWKITEDRQRGRAAPVAGWLFLFP